jgi:purine-nucleoside phosphorylase
MITELQKAQEALKFLRTQTNDTPTFGIILGTGLGGLVENIDIATTIDYKNIPHFPLATVESHSGKLIFGKIGNKTIVAMQGRFHYYEGYSMQEVTFPVRVMHMLGVTNLIISNAAGGMNPLYRAGDIMIIEDHINFIGDNPLIGPNIDEWGPRFPDMSQPYSNEMLALAERVALDLKIKIQKGVYVAVAGPNLETRAEYRMLRHIGADVVGMSTVPENIVAVHMGMNVFGVSIVTDECFPDALKPASLEEIVKVAGIAEPKMTQIITEMINRL